MSNPPPPQPRAAGWIFYDTGMQQWRPIPANLSFPEHENTAGGRNRLKRLGQTTAGKLNSLAKGRRKATLVNRRVAIAQVMGLDIGSVAHVSDKLEVDFPMISKRERILGVVEPCVHVVQFLLAGREKRLRIVMERG